MLALPNFLVLMAGAIALALSNSHARDDAPAKLDALPPAVRAAVETHLSGAEIEGIDIEGTGDAAHYEIEFEIGDEEGSLEVDAAGNLLEYELDVAPGTLPQAVKKGLRQRSHRAKIREAVLVMRESYAVEVALPGGGQFELHVSAADAAEDDAEDAHPNAKSEDDEHATPKSEKDDSDAKSEDEESEDDEHATPKSEKDDSDAKSEDDEADSDDESDESSDDDRDDAKSDDESEDEASADEESEDESSEDGESDDDGTLLVAHLPSAVRAAAFAQSDLGRIEEIEFQSARIVDTYEVAVKHGTHERSLTLTAAGDLLEIEDTADLEHLPAFVQSAVKKVAPEGKIVEVERVRSYSYEIELAIGKRHREVEIDAAGALRR